MIVYYNTIKYTGLLSNFLYMLLAIGVMSAAGLGLQIVEPNTPEHTYFVESLVLGATICMIVIFGCYGMVCDLLSVNLIFTFFILIVLAVEYLQVHNYQPHTRYSDAWQQLELSLAWQNLDKQPELMQHLEQQQHCCGYNNAEDYKNLHLPLPSSCYQQSPQSDGSTKVKLISHGCLATLSNTKRGILHRDKLFMWCIVGLEVFILVQTISLSLLLYKLRQRDRQARQQVPPGVRREPRANHVGSRAQLLDNV
ncbi:protein late bloomer [Drosophila albomicans]|uniref:Protein late bloomer n=1 Tax=Drosophila albomicans TaxID=7291 RepID=A0A6P8YGH4_DROAB|nr:protein late bloomer [Drosophila albomicans]